MACMRQMKGAYRGLVGKPDGKNHLEDPCTDWRLILKMDLQDVGRRSMDWIDLTQNRDN